MTRFLDGNQNLGDKTSVIQYFICQQQLTFCNELSIVEKLTYEPHPTQTNTTLLKQEAVVTVHGIPLSSYFEDFLSKTISLNANKGRQAMEWVIGKINTEVEEMRNNAVVKSVDELITKTGSAVHGIGSPEEAAFTS